MGQKAVEILFDYLSHKYTRPEDEHIIMPSKLVIRESTGTL